MTKMSKSLSQKLCFATFSKYYNVGFIFCETKIKVEVKVEKEYEGRIISTI